MVDSNLERFDAFQEYCLDESFSFRRSWADHLNAVQNLNIGEQ